MSNPNTTLGPQDINSPLKSLLKRLFYGLLSVVGVTAYWRYRNRYKIGILAFHGVMDFARETSWLPTRHRVSSEEFENCIRWLSSRYEFISMDRAVRILSGQEAPVAHALVVSFDDGYRNNFECALPILQRYGVPGIFYVATSYVSQENIYWFDRLDFALQSAAENCEQLTLGDDTYDCSKLSRESLRSVYERLRATLKAKQYTDAEFAAELDDTAARLERESGRSLAGLQDDLWTAVADWDELASHAGSDLVCIGSHSVNHTRLSFAERKWVSRELRESKQHIEQALGESCQHFAYPNGEYDDTARECLAEEGYASAVITQFGLNAVGDDPYTLRRIYPPRVLVKYELLAVVAGLSSSIANAAKALRGKR